MNTWFTSDGHLGHFNIIKYTNRPFKTLEEMDLTIINNFNERVKEDDLVFYVGDFAFRYAPSESPNAPKNAFLAYRNKLNCRNIIFLRGNHDSHNGIKSIIESITIEFGGKRIYLTHNPKFAKKDFYWNFTGHVHGKFGKFTKINNNSYIIDLSVENWNYYPVNINEINQDFTEWLKMEKK